MAEIVKIEDGKEYTADAYLYVPDLEKPSTWKLRIEEEPGKVTVAQLGRAAAALGPGFRGQRVQVSADERRELARKLIALYRELEVDDADIPPYLFPMAGLPRPKGLVIKSMENGLVVGGYGIVWGEQDLVGDTFLPETELDLDVIPNPPVYYNHGQDSVLKKAKIGRVVNAVVDDIGLWIEAQLDYHKKYLDAIAELIEQGVLGWSSGSAGHLVERKDGIIKKWPIVEFSLTPAPAEPRTLGVDLVRSLELQDTPDGEVQEDGDSAPSDDARAGDTESVTTPTTNQEETIMTDNLNTDPVQELDIDAIAEKVAEKLQPVKSVPFAVSNEPPAEDEEVKNFKRFLSGEDVKMNTGTATAGGNYVPTELYRELVKAITDGSIFRRAGARVFNMPSGLTDVPGLTYSAAAALVAEGGTVSPADPTTPKVQFKAYKYAKLTKVSIELAQDSAYDLWNEVLRFDFANAFAEAENEAFTNGTGTNQPQGIVNATVGKTTASKNAITGDEVIDWIYSLAYMYRQNAVIMLSDSAAATIRKLKDTTNQYLWQPGLAAGQPDRILGIPVITNNKLAAVGTANGIVGVVFDPRYYWIGQIPQVEVQRLVEAFATTGEIGYLAFARFDGHIMLADAFRTLKLAAT